MGRTWVRTGYEVTGDEVADGDELPRDEVVLVRSDPLPMTASELREKMQNGDKSIAKKIMYFGASLRGTSQY